MNNNNLLMRIASFSLGFSILILSGLLFSVFSPLNTTNSSPITMRLNIEGDISKIYSESDIKQSLPIVSGWGGKIKTTGSITDPTYWKGINLPELIDSFFVVLDYNLTFLSQDGFYNANLSRDEVNGAIRTSNRENLTLKIKAIPLLAYEEGNHALDSEDGPLRLVLIGENNERIYTDSTLWVKQVDTIQIYTEDGSTLILSTTTQSSIESSSSSTTSKSSPSSTIWVTIPSLVILILYYRKKRNI